MRDKKQINIRVGRNIQFAREAARYTQEELSEIVGITPNHLSAIERGVSGATLELIEKLCRLFGVTSDSLLFGCSQENEYCDEIAARLKSINIKNEYRPHVNKIVTALAEILAIKESSARDIS